MKNKMILFDLDGTLIDSTEAILESFSVAFKTFGMAVPDAKKIKAEIGYPLDVMFRTLGVARGEVEVYVNAYKMHYREIACLKTVLLPNAKEALSLAHCHAVLGVVTTKTAKYSIELLEYMEIMHYFDVLIGREDVTYPKPHPEPIQKALLKLPSDTKKIWMIGDTCMDMDAARAAGVGAVGVSSGYATAENLSRCSDNIYQNVLQAIQFITKS